MIVSQAEFARLCNTKRQTVGKWISRKLLSGPALVEQDGKVLIDVDVAKAQLATRRDPGQVLGNGAKTKVEPAAPVAASASSPRKPASLPAEPDDTDPGEPDDDADSRDYQVQRARLAKAQADAQERKNAEADGALISLSKAEEGWSLLVSAFRSRMLAVPKRLRDALPALTKTDLLKIDAEIREALTELGRAEFIQ